jgi:hypothetical protein
MIYHKNITHTHSHSTPLTSRHINLLTPSKNTLKKKKHNYCSICHFPIFLPTTLHNTTKTPTILFKTKKLQSAEKKKSKSHIYQNNISITCVSLSYLCNHCSKNHINPMPYHHLLYPF